MANATRTSETPIVNHSQPENKGSLGVSQIDGAGFIPAERPKAETEYKKSEIVIVRSAEDRNETFQLTSETQDTFAGSVQHVYSLFKEIGVDNPGQYPQWAKTFVEDFEKSFPDLKGSNIAEKAKEFVESDQGVVYALKIAEWEQATIQMSTQAFIDSSKPDNEFKDTKFRKGWPGRLLFQKVGNLQVNEGDTDPKSLKSTRLRRFFQVGTTRHEDIKRDFNDSQNKEGGNKNIYTGVNFKGGPWGNPSLYMMHATNGLDDLQKAYLKQQGFLSEQGQAYDLRGGYAEAEKHRIADRLNEITTARIDFYEQAGMDRAAIDLNMIDSNGDYKEVLYGGVFLQVDLGSDRADIKQRIEAQIGNVSGRYKKELAGRLAKEAQDRELENLNKIPSFIDEQIESLQKPEKTEEEVSQEQKEKQEEIDVMQERLNKRKQLDQFQKEIDEKDKEIADKSFGTDQSKIQELENAETDLEDLQSELSAKDKVLTRAQDAYHRARSNVATKTRSAEGVESEFVDLNKITKLDTLNDAVAKAQEEKDRAEIEIANKNREISKIKLAFKPGQTAEDNENLMQELKRLKIDRAETEARMQALKKDLEGDNNFVKTQAGGNNLAVLYDTAYFEEKVKELARQKEQIGAPSPEKTRRVGLYETLKKEVIGKYNEIQSRIIDHENSHDKTSITMEKRYNVYPPVYLKTLQIMFGEDLLVPGSENHALFKKASNLVTPEVFMRALQDVTSAGITNFSDPRLHDPIIITATGRTLVEKIIDNLGEDVINGELGRGGNMNFIESMTSAAIQNNALIARYKPELMTPLNTEIDKYGIDNPKTVCYTSKADLARRIMKDRGHLGPAQTPTEKQIRSALAVAESVHERRMDLMEGLSDKVSEISANYHPTERAIKNISEQDVIDMADQFPHYRDVDHLAFMILQKQKYDNAKSIVTAQQQQAQVPNTFDMFRAQSIKDALKLAVAIDKRRKS